MEEIYANIDGDDPLDTKGAPSQSGPRSSKRRCHGAVVLCLGLLSVFLLAALIGLGVHHHNLMHASAAKQARDSSALSSLIEERDQLKTRVSELSKELDSLPRHNRSCPAGWRIHAGSCYFQSDQLDLWERGRQNCRRRGADLVVIDSADEQTFLSNFSEVGKGGWIGLTDVDKEGTWKWIDGSPLTLRYWEDEQPDNGRRNPKWDKEDCVHMRMGTGNEANWNDRSCSLSLRWICEKKV